MCTNDKNLMDLQSDCLFHIFDRLTTDDLFEVSATCKRLFDLTGYHYEAKHPSQFMRISIKDEDQVQLHPNEKVVKYFGRKFRHLIIRGESRHSRIPENIMNFMQHECRKDLKSIRFEKVMLDESQAYELKDFLENAETIILHECNVADDFYTHFLRYCQQLRHLTISDTYDIVKPEEENLWLLQKYPTLQSLHICSLIVLAFDEKQWATFFRQNPQLKSFAIDRLYVTDKQKLPIKVITKNVQQLERVFFSLRGMGHLDDIFRDLSILCKNESVKTMELQFDGSSERYLVRHVKLLSTMIELQGLHFENVVLSDELCAAISAIVHVKRISFRGTVVSDAYWNLLFTTLPNLEEVFIDRLTLDVPSIPIAFKNNVVIHKYQSCDDDARFLSENIAVESQVVDDAKQFHFSVIKDHPWANDLKFLLHVNNTFLHTE